MAATLEQARFRPFDDAHTDRDAAAGAFIVGENTSGASSRIDFPQALQLPLWHSV
jgi:hypothetical protein